MIRIYAFNPYVIDCNNKLYSFDEGNVFCRLENNTSFWFKNNSVPDTLMMFYGSGFPLNIRLDKEEYAILSFRIIKKFKKIAVKLREKTIFEKLNFHTNLPVEICRYISKIK